MTDRKVFIYLFCGLKPVRLFVANQPTRPRLDRQTPWKALPCPALIIGRCKKKLNCEGIIAVPLDLVLH